MPIQSSCSSPVRSLQRFVARGIVASVVLLGGFAVSPVCAVDGAPGLAGPLQGYWSFDELEGEAMAVDISGQGHDGALLEGVEIVEGRRGRAARFANGFAKVLVPPTLFGIDATNELTIACWVMRDGRTGYQTIAQMGRYTYPIALQVSSARIRAGVKSWPENASQAANSFAESNGTFAANEWVHVALVVDGGVRRLYIDGVLDGTWDNAGPVMAFPTSVEPFTLGRTAIDGTPLYGAVDEVMFFDRALSEAAIRSIRDRDPFAGFDTEAPTAPGISRAVATGCNGVEIGWSASTDNSAVTGYKIYRDGALVGRSRTPEFFERSLQASTAYEYEVSALDCFGNESARSAVVGVATLADDIAPRGYVYVATDAGTLVTLGNAVEDRESGMGAGALMQFSNDALAWSAEEPFATTKEWQLANATQPQVYGRYRDPAGNWSEPLVCELDLPRSQPLSVIPAAPGSVRIGWLAQPGVSEYAVLRSGTLGWRGATQLTAAIEEGETMIPVETTAGMRVGDQVHFRTHGEDYYVAEVVDPTHFRLESGVLNPYAVGVAVSLSGGWLKAYDQYAELTTASAAGSLVDADLAPGTDRFYVVRYTGADGAVWYSNPVQVRLVDGKVYHDAAVASNGGYAWKVGQDYRDTWELIDGNTGSFHAGIQCDLPAERSALRTGAVGFQRIALGQPTRIRFLELVQDVAPSAMRAEELLVRFADGASLTFALEDDRTIERWDNGDARTYRIPLDVTSSAVSLFVRRVDAIGEARINWSQVSVLTEEFLRSPVVAAVDVARATLEFDFSASAKTMPAVLGGSDVVNILDGRENGWMVKGWPNVKGLWGVNRFSLSDYWPREYGIDKVLLGYLAAPISADPTVGTIELAQPFTPWNGMRNNSQLQIDGELIGFSNVNGTRVTFSTDSNNGGRPNRGLERTEITAHAAGTPVYYYWGVGQVGRMREILPEFHVVKYTGAYVSGLNNIPSTQDPENASYTPETDPVRRAVATITVAAGDYAPGDVIRMSWEKFKVLGVTPLANGRTELEVRRGFDGTNQFFSQGNVLGSRDIYKLLDYEPYYATPKNDPAEYGNYHWDALNTTLDKVIVDGGQVPFLIIDGAHYTTQHRGRVSSIGSYGAGVNNLITDEYTTGHPEHALWYLLNAGLSDPLEYVLGNRYQFGRGKVHILTGAAEGKVFYIRAHSGNQIRLVADFASSDPRATEVHPVDLHAEGVRPGDAFLMTRLSGQHASMSRRFWQYNADIAHTIVRHIRQNYAAELAGRPLYYEFQNEPNLIEFFGTWNKQVYIDCYNVFAHTFRSGGPSFPGEGYTREELLIGAGAIAGGLNPGSPGAGSDGDYDLALSIVESCDDLDFLSHHRYYAGSRVQKRENPYEYWMLRNYARSLGREIEIIDSEDSVATAGGTGREEARHFARFGVPYWLSNFITSYDGEFGAQGQLALLIQFRTFSHLANNFGIVSVSAAGDDVYDSIYWTLQMFQSHTSTNPAMPDRIAGKILGGDQFGWVEAMATTHGETGERFVHVVNKKATPIVVDLRLHGATLGSGAYMESCIGGGPNQTMGDGYHPLDYAGETGAGPIVRTAVTDLSAIVLEPYSANTIALGSIDPNSYAAWLPMHFSADEVDAKLLTGPQSDPDGDGCANLLEFVLGGDPRQAGDPAPLLSQVVEVEGERYLSITYPRRSNATGVTISLEASDDLQAWTTVDAVESVEAESGGIRTILALDPLPIGSVPRRFLRLRASMD